MYLEKRYLMTEATRKDLHPPNGSRLSCGRNRRWRKEVEAQRKRLAGEATQFFHTCERRQLQAHVRQLPSEPMSGTEAIAAE